MHRVVIIKFFRFHLRKKNWSNCLRGGTYLFLQVESSFDFNSSMITTNLSLLNNYRTVFFFSLPIFFFFKQDMKLKQLVDEYSERWDLISQHFADRSDMQCQQRWQKVVNPELVKGPWTKEVRLSYEFFFFLLPKVIRVPE